MERLTRGYIDNIRATYEQDGVVIVPGLFSKDEVAKIRASALMSLTQLPIKQNLQRRVVDDVEFPALLFWAADWNAYLNKIRCDQRISTLVRAILGENVKQLNNQVYFRLPGDQDEFAWHQDISFRVPKEDFNQIEDGYLQTLVVVDEMDETNGAVEYIPGSHKWGNQELIHRDGRETGLREFKRGDWKGVKYKAKPGDFMMWSVMVVHGSERNETQDRPRMTYMNGFAKAESSKFFPFYMKDGQVIEKINHAEFK